MEITPPQVHMHFELLFKAGKLLIKTVGEPGAQGATVAGMQGMGVSTPKAAVVAVATTGFVMVLQSPKVGIFTSGAWSMIVAARGPEVFTGGPLGITDKTLGRVPKEHCIVAPMQTCRAIS